MENLSNEANSYRSKERHKKDYIQSQCTSKNKRLWHVDPLLNALIYHDRESNLWIVEYYRNDVLSSCALYQSKSTALLVLHSHGYDEKEQLIS